MFNNFYTEPKPKREQFLCHNNLFCKICNVFFRKCRMITSRVSISKLFRRIRIRVWALSIYRILRTFCPRVCFPRYRFCSSRQLCSCALFFVVMIGGQYMWRTNSFIAVCVHDEHQPSFVLKQATRRVFSPYGRL